MAKKYDIKNPQGENQKAEIRTHWKETFGDQDSFLNPYFSLAYHETDTLVIEKEEQIAASLQLLPCTYEDKYGDSHKAAYVFGVMTRPEFRKKGMMRALMLRAIEQSKADQTEAMLLIPQQQYLFDIYSRYGFRPSFLATAVPLGLPTRSGDHKISPTDNELYDFYLRHHEKNSIIVSRQQFLAVCQNLRQESNKIVCAGNGNELKAVALTSQQPQGLEALYMATDEDDPDQDWFDTLAAQINKETKANEISINVPSASGLPRGMYLPLGHGTNDRDMNLATLQLMMDK